MIAGCHVAPAPRPLRLSPPERCCRLQALLALEAGTTAALPDGLRVELEGIQSGGGLQHLQELQQQIKVGRLGGQGGLGGLAMVRACCLAQCPLFSCIPPCVPLPPPQLTCIPPAPPAAEPA